VPRDLEEAIRIRIDESAELSAAVGGRRYLYELPPSEPGSPPTIYPYMVYRPIPGGVRTQWGTNRSRLEDRFYDFIVWSRSDEEAARVGLLIDAAFNDWGVLVHVEMDYGELKSSKLSGPIPLMSRASGPEGNFRTYARVLSAQFKVARSAVN
jgi:DNA helicase HerA-like ATPase